MPIVSVVVRMRKPIVLLTDFGLGDSYVGTMKGVILRINPDVAIVDLCHEIPPQGVAEGAFVLATSYRYFSPDSIFVAVVDPGVGSERRPIALQTPHGVFVGPDNGLLGLIARDHGVNPPPDARTFELSGSSIKGVVLTEQRYFLSDVSATFHGRDVFAPVAAHLSLGVPVDVFGPSLEEMSFLATPRPEVGPGEVIGHVIQIDHFGNVITDVTPEDLDSIAQPILDVAGQHVRGISHHYAERSGLLALFGSSRRLEIAVNHGNAASQLGVRVGARVIIRDAARFGSQVP